MRDGCNDLILGNAVFDRPLQMKRELVDPVERNEARDGHQAAVARRQGRALPDVPEQNLVGDLGQVRRDVAERLACIGGFSRHDWGSLVGLTIVQEQKPRPAPAWHNWRGGLSCSPWIMVWSTLPLQLDCPLPPECYSGSGAPRSQTYRPDKGSLLNVILARLRVSTSVGLLRLARVFGAPDF